MLWNFVQKKIISQFAIGNKTHRTLEIMLAFAFIAILFYQLVCASADRMVSDRICYGWTFN